MPEQQMRLVCTECSFSRVVPKEGQKPADVLVDHGQETGHKLTIQ